MNSTQNKKILTDATITFVITLSIFMFAVFFMLVIQKNTNLIMIDTQIAKTLQGNRLRFFDYLFVLISYMGETKIIIFLCLLLILLPNRKKVGLPVTVLTAVSAILNLLFKIIVARARPDGFFLMTETLKYSMPTGYSFPSGHAQTATVFYLSLCFFASTNLKTLFKTILYILTTIFCILMCFARIYLGVHFFSDVIAGLTMAIFILSLALLINNKHKFFVLNIYEPI